MLNRVILTFVKEGKELNITTHYLEMQDTREEYEKQGFTYVRKQILNY